MKYKITNVSSNTVQLINKYGEKLKKFNATLDGGKLELPKFANWFEECDWSYEGHKVEIEINSLEELIDLKGTIGEPLILFNHEIEIYDDYRE